ncbi:MAG TPA: NlpC/P60 family protein [Actinomycetota bacterium]|nr:NlpC/P60 family protein [Actinomycetota bacterium]
MTGSPSRRPRAPRASLLLIVLVAGVAVVPAASLAAPSKEDVESAKQELLSLQRRFELVVERYNQARYELSRNESRLASTKAEMRKADNEARVALDRLSERAVAAYMGLGSQMDGLLNSDSITEFSDQLEFMGAVATSDAELATAAESARQRAEWAAQKYEEAVDVSRDRVAEMSRSRAEIDRLLDAQEALYQELEADYETFIEAQRAAADQAAAAEATVESPTSSTPPAGDGGSTGFVPPPDASKAQIAVQAAYAVVGTQYVWGSSDPSVGLDCSGVTVYAWRQAGVSLPHSSLAQYTSYPRIPLSAVQPGDLVYYGNFGPHIAIYVGGGQIIHASSPAPGGQTRLDSMYGYDEPWGAVRVA